MLSLKILLEADFLKREALGLRPKEREEAVALFFIRLSIPSFSDFFWSFDQGHVVMMTLQFVFSYLVQKLAFR